MEQTYSTVRLVPDVRVRQYVNRTALTGRKMHSVKILIPVQDVAPEFATLRINTPWCDMPYKLRAWELKRIQRFTEDMISAGLPIDEIRWDIGVLYDAGLPKLINCSDWERLEIMSQRSRARKGTVRISRFKYGHRTEMVDGQWKAVDMYWAAPRRKAAARK